MDPSTDLKLRVATILLTVLGFVITIVIFRANSRRESQIRRADLFRNYTNDFYNNKEIGSLFAAIDSGTFEFLLPADDSSATDLGTAKELALDQLLDIFNNLGYNFSIKVFKLRDIASTTLGYAMVRVHSNGAVQDYLAHVQEANKRYEDSLYTAGNAWGYFRNMALELANYSTPDHIPPVEVTRKESDPIAYYRQKRAETRKEWGLDSPI